MDLVLSTLGNFSGILHSILLSTFGIFLMLNIILNIILNPRRLFVQFHRFVVKKYLIKLKKTKGPINSDFSFTVLVIAGTSRN